MDGRRGPLARGLPDIRLVYVHRNDARNGTPPTSLSRAIEKIERHVAQMADSLLVPGWLRENAAKHLGVANETVHAFTMDGRLANQWDCPLDFGAVKREIHFGPMDRLVLFIGPLEYAAGPDLLLEAMPVLLQRANNLRVAFVGAGDLYGELDRRGRELGVGYAVRLLGHQEGAFVTRLLRAAEALVLPSRYRVPFDDAVVDLARRAGRPVITTHGGPAHLVRHEETGLVTYDNPGSIVWAVDRILGDPTHAQHMGRQGQRGDRYVPNWSEVVHDYLDLCIACFPQLTRGPAQAANA